MQFGLQPCAIPIACDPDCIDMIEPFAHCGWLDFVTVWFGTSQNGCRSQQTSMIRPKSSDCLAFTDAITACVLGIKNSRCKKRRATNVLIPTWRLFMVNNSIATCCSSNGSSTCVKTCLDLR